MDIHATTLPLIIGAFFAAGLVKGMVGLGLPPLVLGLITASVGLHSAMGLVVLPALVTNLIQAYNGPYLKSLLVEHLYFFSAATVSVLFGGLFALVIDSTSAAIFLGILLITYSALGIFNIQVKIPGSLEPTAGLTMGFFNGVMTGVTGSSAVPGIFYLQSIGLKKDRLIQSMGVLFSLSGTALFIVLYIRGILTLEVGLLSMLSLVPAVFGIFIGAKIRNFISVSAFKMVFHFSLILLGIYIVSINY